MNREPLSEPEPEKVPGTFSGPTWMFVFAWALNLAVLAGACCWIFADGKFIQPNARGALLEDRNTGLSVELAEPDLMWRVTVVVGAALVSSAAILAGLFFGPRWHRRLSTWLALTALAAAWLALWAAWPTLAWAGQRWRAGQQINSYESVAAPLRQNWPVEDGATKALGPFSAYPIGRATKLMPLTTRTTGGFGFTSVERSPRGGLRFELTGNMQGAWLEWHPKDEGPASFVGGVETKYELILASSLSDGWYLVRYRVAGIAG